MAKPIGLQEGIETKEKIVKIDEKTAKRYKVVEETIDLEALRREKEGLEQILNMPEPSKEELIELGKSQHPYYMDKDDMRKRLDWINSVLGE